jgi:PKD repeat protein
MRRFYTALALLTTSLFFMQANAQNEVANFTFTISGNTVHFTNTSNTAPGDTAMRRCLWLFGDGSSLLTHYSTNPTHTYAQYGTYNACLKLYKRIPVSTPTGDSLQLISSICKTFILQAPDSCTANFETLPVSSNLLQKIFIAQPWHNNNKRPERICWTFGDGTDTCIFYPNPTTTPPPNGYTVAHQYAQPGTYTVCVSIRYHGGCEAHYCKTIQVGPPDTCTAGFVVGPLSTTPLGKMFTAIPGHSNNKKPWKICWNFGDGRDTCIVYPTGYTGPYTVHHNYNAPGQYNVCVKIFYIGGCEATYCQMVHVGSSGQCTADFERAPVTGTTPLTVGLVAIPWHSSQNRPAYICWNFGDGRDTCIQYSNTYPGPYFVSHTYTAPGTYNVCVKIVYVGGCIAIKCKQVQVGQPDSCTADFERMPPIATTPLTVGLKALPWHSANKKPVKICWNFGDGRDTCITYPNSYTGPYTVVHTYTAPGQYNICVKIFYEGGCEAVKCKQATIGIPETCSAQIYQVTPSITSLTRGLYVITSSSANRRIERICWKFGDGTDTCIVPTNTNPIPLHYISHTYPGPGVYHTCVRVLFAGGCVAESCIEVVIHSNVNACGGFFTDSVAGRTGHFRAFSIRRPLNDPVIGYRWSFGNGVTANGQHVSHTYSQPGTYTVCLQMKTVRGCETRICNKVTVGGTNTPALILTPNPVVTVLNALFYSTHQETVTIKIINSSGAAVRTYTRNAVIGANNWSFDLTGLQTGIYNFIVQSPNQLASAIFIKQ